MSNIGTNAGNTLATQAAPAEITAQDMIAEINQLRAQINQLQKGAKKREKESIPYLKVNIPEAYDSTSGTL